MSATLLRRFAFAVLPTVGAGSLAACDTAEGLGDDVEAAGDGVEEALDWGLAP